MALKVGDKFEVEDSHGVRLTGTILKIDSLKGLATVIHDETLETRMWYLQGPHVWRISRLKKFEKK